MDCLGHKRFCATAAVLLSTTVRSSSGGHFVSSPSDYEHKAYNTPSTPTLWRPFVHKKSNEPPPCPTFGLLPTLPTTVQPRADAAWVKVLTGYPLPFPSSKDGNLTLALASICTSSNHHASPGKVSRHDQAAASQPRGDEDLLLMHWTMRRATRIAFSRTWLVFWFYFPKGFVMLYASTQTCVRSELRPPSFSQLSTRELARSWERISAALLRCLSVPWWR